MIDYFCIKIELNEMYTNVMSWSRDLSIILPQHMTNHMILACDLQTSSRISGHRDTSASSPLSHYDLIRYPHTNTSWSYDHCGMRLQQA